MKWFADLSKTRRERLLALLILIFGAFCLFSNTFGNAWTYDDLPVVVENADIRSLGAFFRDAYPGRPLREITYLLDYSLFGLNPPGYHIQNILWHGLNAGLIFILVRRLQGGRSAAWIASLLFLVHPVQVEAVANISHRKESLLLAFALLSVLVYMEAVKRSARRFVWVAASLGLAFVACLGKENAVVLPLVFVAYELACVPREQRILLKYPSLAGLLAAVGTAAVATWFFFFGGKALHQEQIVPLLVKMNFFGPWTEKIYSLMVLKSWLFIWAKLAWPVDLAVEYTYSLPVGWTDPWVLSAIIAMGTICALAVVSLRRWPPVFFGLLWFVLFWLPVSNLWPTSYFAADRYLYAPSAGLFIAVGYSFQRLLPRISPAMGALLLLLVTPLVFLTWQQNGVWRSAETLWTQAARVSPTSTFALSSMGNVFVAKGDMAKASEFFEQAVRLNPSNPGAVFNLGWVYEKRGMLPMATHYYRTFLSMPLSDPTTKAKAQELRQHLLTKYGIRLD